MSLNKSIIHKILVISLSNIGDVIMTFPVIDILRQDFPDAELSVVIGPNAQSLLAGNLHLERIHIFDKRQSVLKTLKWLYEMRRENFDLIVDLRNSAIPLFIAPKFRTSFVMKKFEEGHRKEKHLNHLKTVYQYENESNLKYCLYMTDLDKEIVAQVISEFQHYVVVAPGSANPQKRWDQKQFAKVCDALIDAYDKSIVFVGDENDHKTVQNILKHMNNTAVNLCGRTNLIQLAEVLQQSELVLTNDSAPMHLASYLNKPTVALFGPSNPVHYGPWSKSCTYVQSSSGDILEITAEQVLNAVNSVKDSIEFY